MARISTTIVCTITSVGAPDSGSGIAYSYQWATADGAYAGAGLVTGSSLAGPQDVLNGLKRLMATDINDSEALGSGTCTERNILIV